MSVNSVSNLSFPEFKELETEYLILYRYHDKHIETISQSWHFTDNPLNYAEHQPGYEFETFANALTINMWKVALVDMFIAHPKKEGRLSGIIYCTCILKGTRHVNQSDIDKQIQVQKELAA